MELKIRNNKNDESKNVQTAQVINPISTVVAPAVEDADAVEIKDETPSNSPRGEKKPVTLKRKITTKKSEAKTAAQYAIQEYTTKKGGTAYLLFGFGSKEAAENIAAQCSKTISASWRTGENGEKRYCLSLGTRYGDVAKAMCDALNAKDGTALATAMADSRKVYDKAVADGKAAREQKKQERAEKKAAKEAEVKAEEEPAPAAKTYTDKDVAEMLRGVLAGKELPKEVAVLMAA